jgi:drug/metabolite transporter (DMT)-like permease
MNFATIIAMVLSVLLTSTAQLLLKFGMSAVNVKVAIASGRPVTLLTGVAFSPWVIGGLICFGLSVGLWLSVLSKVNVSQAYPCVSLGFVLTMLGGHFLLGEVISMGTLLGLMLIVFGVGVVALS